MSNKEITLRVALPEDAHVLTILAASTYMEAFSGMMPQNDINTYIEEAFSRHKLAAELAEEGVKFILAFLDHHLIGYAKLNLGKPAPALAEDKVLEMERLCILKAFQSYRAGSKLMQYCIAYAQSKQFAVLWLAVWEKNEKAIAFYKQWGFAHFNTQLYKRGGDVQVELLMKKELTPMPVQRNG